MLFRSKLRPELRVIVMSAQNTLLTAVKATERGAFEYLPKPFDLKDLVATVQRALTQPRETVGRTGEASILLDDVTVSRRHAAIEEEADGRYLVDLASLNGTYVNNRRIERVRLRDGDELQIGKFKLTYLE